MGLKPSNVWPQTLSSSRCAALSPYGLDAKQSHKAHLPHAWSYDVWSHSWALWVTSSQMTVNSVWEKGDQELAWAFRLAVPE